MNVLPLVMDGLIALMLLGLAASSVFSRNLIPSVVQFIVFGVVMALAWARLRAPDIAITEAALGAGLTGALLLAAAYRLKRTGEDRLSVQSFPRLFRVAAGLALVVFALFSVTQLWPLLHGTAQLTGHVQGRMEVSGVQHPLTAVLLNFRGYDTMLEVGVLLLVVAAVWGLYPGPKTSRAIRAPESHSPVLRFAIGLLLPVTVVAAGAMVWVGAYRPGGAFQAGTVLGALWVLLSVTGVLPVPPARGRSLRIMVAAGFLLFVSVALLLGVFRNGLLAYPPAAAGMIILVIETALTVSIAAAIGILFTAVLAPVQAGSCDDVDGGGAP